MAQHNVIDIPLVKLLPPLDALPKSSKTNSLPVAPTKEGDAIILPCFPLDKQTDARVVPHTKDLRFFVTESSYIEMMQDVERSRKLFSQWSKRFVATQVFRSPVDGGHWQLAEIGVILRLDKMEEVKGEPGEIGYELTCSAMDRVRLRHVLNPESFAERTTYLRVKIESFKDHDETEINLHKEETRGLETLLQEVLHLQISLNPEVRAVLDRQMMSWLKTKVSMVPDVWKLAALWQSCLEIQKSIKEMSEARTTDPRNQKQTKFEASESIEKEIHDPLPLQQLIQATSYLERLRIFSLVLHKEKHNIERKMERIDKVSLLNALNSSTGANDNAAWVPFGFTEKRSNL